MTTRRSRAAMQVSTMSGIFFTPCPSPFRASEMGPTFGRGHFRASEMGPTFGRGHFRASEMGPTFGRGYFRVSEMGPTFGRGHFPSQEMGPTFGRGHFPSQEMGPTFGRGHFPSLGRPTPFYFLLLITPPYLSMVYPTQRPPMEGHTLHPLPHGHPQRFGTTHLYA